MAIFGFKSKKEVEAEKQQAAQNAVHMAEVMNQHNVGNLGRGSQVEITIPWFDAFDPRLQDTGVPVAVDVTVSYAIEDMPTFLSMNKMEVFSDDVFQEKLRSGVTKYVKSAVSNAPSEAQIPLVQIERKIVEVSDYVQSRVLPQVERVFCIKVRALDITEIRIDKSSYAFRQLESLTADFEKERMRAQQSAQLKNFNMQTEMQQEQMMAQHNAQMSNFNLQNEMQQSQLQMQNALNLDAMQRQHEMKLSGQEQMQQMQLDMQQMQLDMQQKQMNIQLNNMSETMRVQREEMQREARLQTESAYLDAHKANLNSGMLNNAMDNGYDPFQQQSMSKMGNMQQPMMGGMQSMGMQQMGMSQMGGMQPMGMQPMGMQQMGGMMGQKSMMQPQVSYMLAVNGQQMGPFDWAQLQQLVQQGNLTQQTHVWTQGMANWTPAGQVQELAPLFQGMAPGMPQMPQMI